MRITTSALAVLLLVLAADASQALTLGRMRGAALVGQGLDISIQVQMDPEDTSASLCLEADVFHADTRVDGSRVQIAAEPAQAAQTVNVRVQSSAVVDEPVVTVYLRAGCSQKTSRRYVLLADVVTEPAASAAVRSVPLPQVSVPSIAVPGSSGEGAFGSGAAAGGAVARVAPVAPATASADQPRKSRPAAARPPAAQGRRASPPKPAAAKPAPATETAEKLSAGRSAGQSRLKLDPLEVLSERVASLETSTATLPTDIAARQALEAQRLQTLEDSVKSLVALAARNEASLMEMRTQLQKAESERYWNPVVYGLAALLLLCLCAMAFLLWRRDRTPDRRGEAWWNGQDSVQPVQRPAETASELAPVSAHGGVSAPGPLSMPVALQEETQVQTQQMAQRAGARSIPAPITQVDVSLVEMSESTFDRLMQSGASHSAVRKSRAGEPSQPVPLLPAARRRAINSEELFDIRQQADFFVSLGQTDQAVRILENRISESGESSPLAYLDLLKIFHSLGLKADFRQVREDFNLLFNARVPEFSSFSDEGRGLEEYPDTLAELVEEWGTPSIFARIEADLFLDSETGQRERFDLAAFRDLLLLHAIAQWAASASDSLPGPLLSGVTLNAGVQRYARTPPYADTLPVAQTGVAGAAVTNAPLPSIDGVAELDIDLSDLVGLQPPTAALPELPTAPRPAGPAAAADNLIDFDLGDALPPNSPGR